MPQGSRVVDHTSPVSDLLRAWGQGNTQARDDLLPLVYAELRAQAHEAGALEKVFLSLIDQEEAHREKTEKLQDKVPDGEQAQPKR